MYKRVIRPVLFLVDPERIHHFIFGLLNVLCRVPGMRILLKTLYHYEDPVLERTVAGLRFSNPVGLAAGFDKDARLIDELGYFGFGFIEIGTLTPLPQEGNPRPRLFRLITDHALINRMGFNNEGVIAAVDRLKKRKSNVLVGGNIGKNKSTPNEKAADDYSYCFEALYPFVDYFVVNVSSPNTPGLRALQDREPLKALLLQVKALSQARPLAKPIFLKISPDLNVQQLDDVIEILTETGTDGVIATNTTVSREGLHTPATEIEAVGSGGLSGRPLTTKSNEVVKYLRRQLPPGFPIIGVGGIMSEHDALERIRAGADLIQIYTGFIYEGPMFVRRLKRAIAETGRASS